MRAGAVVSIRVNPRDCQSTLDVLESVGFNTRGLSFSQLVSLAFSSLLETQRLGKFIPEPDEFEYLNRMGQYLGQGKGAKKNIIAKTIHNQGGSARMTGVHDDLPSKEDYKAPEVTAEQRAAGSRLAELDAKKELAQTNSAVLWSLRDDAEYQQLYKQVYG